MGLHGRTMPSRGTTQKVTDFKRSYSIPARSNRLVVRAILLLIIVAILAAAIVPVHRSTDYSLDGPVIERQHIEKRVKPALEKFKRDVGRYPTTDEGLSALTFRPSGVERWRGPYGDVPKSDLWNHRYIYRSPAANGDAYLIISMGPDGHEGGGDDIVVRSINSRINPEER